jgi:molybdenum cofactor synthesis domain-containing protein
MQDKKTAAVLIIGNEILSGRTKEENLGFLGQRLSDLGIYLLEACIIPDNKSIIINKVNYCRSNFNYVFTTGGIGPTHDDITSASIARAFNVELIRNQKAATCLEEYYAPGTINEARLKMADIPDGAILIENPVSGAPGFQLENVFVLPGVPSILQAMFDGITDRLVGGPRILTRSVSTNLRESTLAEGLEKIQNDFPDVTIGSYPYFKGDKLGVNLVIRATEEKLLNSAFEQILELIDSADGRIIDSK